MQTSNEELKDNSVTGLHVTFLTLFFALLIAILFCIIFVISNYIFNRYKILEQSFNKFNACEQGADLIKESSNFLTEQARLFVITGKSEYVRTYLEEINVTRRQEKAIENLKKFISEDDLAFQRLKIAIDQEKGLRNLELYAIRLAYEIFGKEEIPLQIAEIPLRSVDVGASVEKLRDSAVKNLFGEGYMIYKSRVNENCRLTIEALEQQVKGELIMNSKVLVGNIRLLRFLFLTLIILVAALFVSILLLLLIPLKKFKASIENGDAVEVTACAEIKFLSDNYNQVLALKEQNENSLLKKAEYDPATGLLNRNSFDQICKASAEKKQQIALLLVDVDNFQSINKIYGPHGGELALNELSRILMETFRTDDYVARIGGDEFAVILPNCTNSAINIIKQKILTVNEKLLNIKDNIKSVSVSVGVAFSDDGYSEDLFKKADKALYIVKEKGKRGCEIYEENYVTEE